MEKVVVLVSGGLDSAVALWWALKKGWEIHGLSFNFHKRNPREIEASRRLCEEGKVSDHIVVDLPFLKEASDLEPSARERLQRISPAYIPRRNMVFYSIAGYWADVLGASKIVGGHNDEDAMTFPDASSRFILNLNKLLESPPGPEILTPLINLRKDQVVKLALELGAPIELTWSCYGERPVHCGRCQACVARKEAFAKAAVPDMTHYEN